MGVFHGGGLDAVIARYGGNREDWLDLSTGINPNPYPVPRLSAESWTRLPDNLAEEKLMAAARKYYKVPDGFEIVAANGTQALIELLPRVIEASEVAVFSPTYGEHAHAWTKAEAKVAEVSQLYDINADTCVAVMVNPNNPNADVRPTSELKKISDQLDCLIVDEAFCDPTPEASILTDPPHNVIVLKSFGKFFGLAGMRLGFVICKSQWAERFRNLLGPWAVCGPALEVGARAFEDTTWTINARNNLFSMSTRLAAAFGEAGLKVEGVHPLFIYVKHAQAGDIYDHLACNRILVRPFADQPDHLRFGLCRGDWEFERLVNALRAFGNG